MILWSCLVLMVSLMVLRYTYGGGISTGTDGNIIKALPVGALYKKGANLTITCSGNHTFLSGMYPNMMFAIEHNNDSIVGPTITELDYDENDNQTTYNLHYEKPNIMPTDSGLYSCVIYDKETVGTLTEKHRAFTTIYMADKADLKPEIIVPSLSNNVASLYCDVSVQPQTELACDWLVDRTVVTNNGRYHINGCNMSISNFKAQDANKVYSCRVGTEKAKKHYGSLSEATTAVFHLKTYFVLTRKSAVKQCVEVFEPKDGSKHQSTSIYWEGVDGNVTMWVNGRVVVSCQPEDADISNGSITVTVGDDKKTFSTKELFSGLPPAPSSTSGGGLSEFEIVVIGIVVVSVVCGGILIWVIVNVCVSCRRNMWNGVQCNCAGVCKGIGLVFGAVIQICCKKGEEGNARLNQSRDADATAQHEPVGGNAEPNPPVEDVPLMNGVNVN